MRSATIAVATIAGGGALWLGCGSEVHIVPSATKKPSLTACQGSFVCQDGERCDGGRCVVDEGCPPPMDPVELAVAGTEPYLIVGHGSAYLFDRNPFGPEPESTESTFTRLPDGSVSFWPHTFGVAGCFDGLAPCTIRTQGEGVFIDQLVLDEGSATWHASSEHAYPAEWNVVERWQGGALMWRDSQIGFWAKGETVELWLDLGAAQLQLPVVRPAKLGRPERFVAVDYASNVTWYTAPVEKFAVLTPIASVAAGKTFAVLVDRAEGYFAVVDTPLSEEVRVFEIDNDGAANPVGAKAEPALIDVAQRYATTSATLNADRQGHGISCGYTACSLVRADFKTLETYPLAALTLALGEYSESVRERWLACNAVDMVLRVRTGEPGAYTIHFISARLREGDQLSWP